MGNIIKKHLLLIITVIAVMESLTHFIFWSPECQLAVLERMFCSFIAMVFKVLQFFFHVHILFPLLELLQEVWQWSWCRISTNPYFVFLLVFSFCWQENSACSLEGWIKRWWSKAGVGAAGLFCHETVTLGSSADTTPSLNTVLKTVICLICK